jgi:hypothetical protein
MVRSNADGDEIEELNYGNTPSPDYTVEDLVKMISVKNSDIKGGNKAAYQNFIDQVSEKVDEHTQNFLKNYLLS